MIFKNLLRFSRALKCASLALVTDSDFFLGTLDPTLFPGLSSSIEVHSGFRDEQAKCVIFGHVISAVDSR